MLLFAFVPLVYYIVGEFIHLFDGDFRKLLPIGMFVRTCMLISAIVGVVAILLRAW